MFKLLKSGEPYSDNLNVALLIETAASELVTPCVFSLEIVLSLCVKNSTMFFYAANAALALDKVKPNFDIGAIALDARITLAIIAPMVISCATYK